MESLDKRIKRVTEEEIRIEPYNSAWPSMFKNEKEKLLFSLPNQLINRIEHFGSTAVPNLSAKPIIDMLVEVTSLDEIKKVVVPLLESQGYEYFWRPMGDENVPPFYAWFIKRDVNGNRTHHIHMVEPEFSDWDRLHFKNYLIENMEVAKEYQDLKYDLSKKYKNDRIEYTKRKGKFIKKYTNIAKMHYENI